MRVDLRGKVIAITGASSGIGAATALACARAGMAVVLGARRVEKLEVVVGEIRR
ncbi:MAG: SDR family NAD(P)-dependent oxidoreductase, partial [bacterium]